MHSIVTTFREAVIKVEVANFCAAMDTLIDQDGNTHNLCLVHVLPEIFHVYWIVLLLPSVNITYIYLLIHDFLFQV